MGWIGVDFDKTLASYDVYRGPDHVGEPLLPMINFVRELLENGEDVRIFTARISHNGSSEDMVNAQIATVTIMNWCLEQFGKILPITNVKSYDMECLYDDIAIQMQPNTGLPMYKAENYHDPQDLVAASLDSLLDEMGDSNGIGIGSPETIRTLPGDSVPG